MDQQSNTGECYQPTRGVSETTNQNSGVKVEKRRTDCQYNGNDHCQKYGCQSQTDRPILDQSWWNNRLKVC